jgi:hypothetical protein
MRKVFMAPANCAEGTGWMLISGDPARLSAPGRSQARTPECAARRVVQ